MFFIILFLSIHFNCIGSCTDYLKDLISDNTPYVFKELRVGEANGNKIIGLVGRLKNDSIDKTLATLEYQIENIGEYGDEIDIDLMFTNTSIRGLGVQKILFQKLLDEHPKIKRINSALTSDNEDIIKRSLMKILMKNGYDIKTFSPGGSSEEIFEQCCGELFSSLSKVQRETFIKEAIYDTPAYKIRKRLGLDWCEEQPMGTAFSRRNGEFSLTVHIVFCRP